MPNASSSSSLSEVGGVVEKRVKGLEKFVRKLPSQFAFDSVFGVGGLLCGSGQICLVVFLVDF